MHLPVPQVSAAKVGCSSVTANVYELMAGWNYQCGSWNNGCGHIYHELVFLVLKSSVGRKSSHQSLEFFNSVRLARWNTSCGPRSQWSAHVRFGYFSCTATECVYVRNMMFKRVACSVYPLKCAVHMQAAVVACSPDFELRNVAPNRVRLLIVHK